MISVAPYKYARDETRSPCICLTCGDVVVRSASSTSNPLTPNSIISSILNFDQTMGPCNLHTQQCCGSIGLYLRVKECSLLLLNIINDGRANKARGTLMPAPYLDEYGETDQNLRYENLFFISKMKHFNFILDAAIHCIYVTNDTMHYIVDGYHIQFLRIYHEIWN